MSAAPHYRLTTEEVLHLFSLGLRDTSLKLYLYYLSLNPFGDRDLPFRPADLALLLGCKKTAIYDAAKQLQELELLDLRGVRGTARVSPPNFRQNGNLSGKTENEGEITSFQHEELSAKTETFPAKRNQFRENGNVSAKTENRSLEPALGLFSESPHTSSNSSDLIQTLSLTPSRGTASIREGERNSAIAAQTPKPTIADLELPDEPTDQPQQPRTPTPVPPPPPLPEPPPLLTLAQRLEAHRKRDPARYELYENKVRSFMREGYFGKPVAKPQSLFLKLLDNGEYDLELAQNPITSIPVIQPTDPQTREDWVAQWRSVETMPEDSTLALQAKQSARRRRDRWLADRTRNTWGIAMAELLRPIASVSLTQGSN